MSTDTRTTRRRLLGQALGAAALATAFESAQAQTPPGGSSPPRIRDSFDFGWKFFKGDAPGAQQPDFSDSSWRSLDLPHDWSIEGPFGEKEPTGGPGGYSADGHRLVPEALPPAGVVQGAGRSRSSSTASTRTARFGSTASISASARSDTSASRTTSLPT